jgi:hypothetical protein
MDDIGYGLHMIVPDGRHGFGLSGTPLLNFIRASLRTLLDAGAVPVEDYNNKVRATRWGDDKNAIIEGMISDWLDAGAPDAPEWGKHWLMWPKYVKNAQLR